MAARGGPDKLYKQWGKLQNGERMQFLIPENYFSEEGGVCFSSDKAVDIQEYTQTYTYTHMGVPTLPGRTGNL